MEWRERSTNNRSLLVCSTSKYNFKPVTTEEDGIVCSLGQKERERYGVQQAVVDTRTLFIEKTTIWESENVR